MYLDPELVEPEKRVHEPSKLKEEFPEILKYQKLAAKTQSGTVDDATSGSADKGARLVRRAVERIVRFLSKSGP